MAGLGFEILRVCAVIHIEAAKGSQQYPYLPLPLQTPLDLLVQMAQVVEQLAQHLGPVAVFSCSGPNSKPAAFWVTQLTDWSHTLWGRVSSKIQGDPLGSFFIIEGTRCDNLSFTLAEYLDIPHTTGTLEISLRKRDPELLSDLFPTLSHAPVLL